MTNRTAIDTIAVKLIEVFAELDADVLENSKLWIEGRAKAVFEYQATDEARALARTNQWGYYEKLFALAGGKTWYTVIRSNNATGRAAFVIKNCATIVAKRNANIASKLAKAGVTEVTGSEFSFTKDGFNGVFNVKTDAGDKRVIINTIIAGGWNIQCRHLRVLVKVK